MKAINHWVLLILTLFFSVTIQANYPQLPKPFRYISDYTQTLTQADQQGLENTLTEYSTQTSSQIAVVILPTTHGEDIASYTHKLFDLWGIGQKIHNNGVLMLIAKNDRKIFIATGRGLESALPDAITASIIRNDITPYFKQNHYAQGIRKGLVAIISATKGEYAPSAIKSETEGYDDFPIFMIAGIAIFIFIWLLGGRNNHYISPNTVHRTATILSRSQRHGGINGNFGHSGRKGGFGSSGGFGGGSTGGGGAGGSW